MEPRQKFRKNQQIYIAQKKKLEKKAGRLSWMRLVIFLLAFGGIYVATNYNFPVLLMVIFFFVIIFFRVVFLHFRATQSINQLRRLRDINKNELKSLDHNLQPFDGGKEYFNPGHYFTSDLNIFGEHSIFKIINRTVTEHGKQILAGFFNTPPKSAERTHLHQNAVKELSQNLDFLQAFMETGQRKQFTEQDYQHLSKWAEMPARSFFNRTLLAYGFSVLSLALIILIVSGIFYWPVIIFWIIAGLIITGFFSRESKNQHQYLTKLDKAIDTASKLIEVINKNEFHSELLKNQQNKISSITGKGPLRKLSRILQSFDVRLNVFAAFLLNSLFLWDVHQLARLYRWKNQYSRHLRKWLETMFYFDAFVSLGNFAFSYPDYNYAEAVAKHDGNFIIYGKNCKHILIPKPERVGNPVHMDKRGNLSIITGANMAGKSTYLRTIGINMLLGSIGLPVDCDEFKFTPVQLITSLSMKDSLVKNESFFYAELKRLQLIIQKLEQGSQLFFLLDEILKGTNSKDKQTGSVKLVKKLISLKSNGIIATHDLHLGNLEKEYPDHIQNHCFEVEIQNDKLYFDYKLKEGIAQSLNASFLMRKMGITE